MQEGNFEQEFMNRVQVVPVGQNNKNKNWYKVGTLALGVLAIVLIIVIVILLLGKNSPAECNCEASKEERKPYGDFSIVYEDDEVKELLMFCRADNGWTFELMDDFAYEERDADAEYVDYGTYSILEGEEIILELSSDRVDKYVYFNGESLINMDKVYHCLYEEE